MAKVQTIQATGKNWKAMKACGFIALAIGVVALLGGMANQSADLASSGLALSGLGLFSYLCGKIGAWWNHA